MNSENVNSEDENEFSEGMEGDEIAEGDDHCEGDDTYVDENLDEEENTEINASEEMDPDGLEMGNGAENEGNPDEGQEENKAVFGKNRRNQMFKSKAPAKINKKEANSDEELSNADTTDEYSSSETDGEIEIPIEMDIRPGEVNNDAGGEEKEEFKHPDIQLPEGEPLSVVAIKQEYEEDDEMLFRDEDDGFDDTLEEFKGTEYKYNESNKIAAKPSKKKKAGKPEATEEDLRKINIVFTFICQLCDQKCSDSVSLTDHMQQSHSDRIGTYMCATCQRVYQNAEHLRTHMLCHVQLGTYECPDCKKVYHHPASLVSHRRRWHKKEGQPHECKECGKTYSILSDLNTHMKSHMSESFPCSYCDKAFRTDRYLRLHTRHVHLGHKHLRIECKICNKSFQKKSMAAHMKVHHLGKVHKCHYCEKSMTTHYSLMAHIRRHEGVKPFVCQICDKGFVDKGKLARHVNSHSGTRNFQCEVCNKSFSERQYLRQHRRIHEAVKEYPCRMCGAIFRSMNSVWSHMRKHTQSERYKCDQCGKTCYRPDHLRSHMVSHTGVKEYQCEICSKRFAKSYDLTEHMRSHSGEKPYSCTLCDRSFARHGEFRKHKMSKYHREREIEAGLPVSFPNPPPRRPKGSAIHQCGSCDKKFSSVSGLTAHMRRKSHVPKNAIEQHDAGEDTYHDPEGFEEDHNENEMQSLPALQELPNSLRNRNLQSAILGDEENLEKHNSPIS